MRKTTTLTLVLAVLALGPALLAASNGAQANHQPATFATFTGPNGLLYVADAGEPSVGVNPITGKVMYQSFAATYQITVNPGVPSASWLLKKPTNSIINVDPILATDAATGRTWAGGLDGPCSVMSFTDNDGNSWTPMANVCAGAAIDHPTIGSGPWPATSPPPSTYSRAVYYCAQTSVVQCATSFDGGLTFGPGVNVACGFINPGLHGSVHVGPDGKAYLPFKNCGAVSGVSVSTNGGFSWIGKPISTATAPTDGFDPDVATTPNGDVWVAYPTSGWGVGVARGTPGGGAWVDFGDVAAGSGVQSATFHEMVAGANGKVAVAYLGSTTNGNPHDPSFNGEWYVYVSFTDGNGAHWTTVKASNNVIQRGWICADGTGCGTGRNLLDFIDASVDSAGRIVIAVADGCVGNCENAVVPWSSNSAWATLVYQTGGTLLI